MKEGGIFLQHSKQTGSNLKRKITATLLSLAIVGTSAAPLVSTVAANAASAEEDSAVGAARLPHSNNDGIFWANATYFDYYSDSERSNGWRNNIQAGTGFNGSQDNWFPFYQFNQQISSIANANSAWSKPLYFGNMIPADLPDNPYYTTSAHPNGLDAHGGPYSTATSGLTRFDKYANNSNTIGGDHKSVQGLMQPSLKNGQLMATSTLAAPYFDANQLNGYAKIIDAAFPFRMTNENGYTKYSFDSTGGTDNVNFSWNGNTPTQVNYASGANNAVKDGLRYFMTNTNSGYGIFPFNEKSKTESYTSATTYKYLYATANPNSTGWNNIKCYFPGHGSWPGTQMEWCYDDSDGTKVFRTQIPQGATSFVLNDGTGNGGWQQSVDGTYEQLKHGMVYVIGDQYDAEGKKKMGTWDGKYNAGIETYQKSGQELDYGFGIRIDAKFRVPKDQQSVTFKFSGDDDLWMYITDEDDPTHPSQLVLDMGGDHKMSTGTVDFISKKSTVDAVYNSSGAVVNNFDFNPDHTYTMSVFYMERGLLESNCKMEFTMVPLGNNVIVTEQIDTAEVNPALANDVKAAASFDFTATNGTTSQNFTLANGGKQEYPGTFTTGSDVTVTQKQDNSDFKYTTRWVYKNNTKTPAQIGSGNGNSKQNVSTNAGTLIAGSGDTYDYAELQADYVNTPVVKNVAITKSYKDWLGNTADNNQEFDAQVYISVTGKDSDYKLYNFKYVSEDGTANGPSTEYDSELFGLMSEAANGVVKLKAGRTITIPNVPVGAKVKVVETLSGAQQRSFAAPTYTGNEQKVTDATPGMTVGVVNSPNLPASANVPFEASKLLTGALKDKANLKDNKFTFVLEDVTGSTPKTLSTVSNADNGSVDLGTVIFTADADVEGDRVYYIAKSDLASGKKTYKFRIHETVSQTNSSVIYDEKTYDAVVDVTYDSANNKLVASFANGTADEIRNNSVKFENEIPEGQVTITKKVFKDNGEEDTGAAETFSATIEASYNGGVTFTSLPFYYTDSKGGQGQLTPVSGSTSKGTYAWTGFKHGDSITIKGLPIGTVVKVTETQTSGFVTTYTVGTNTANQATVSAIPAEITIKNTRKSDSSLTLGVSKSFTETAINAGVQSSGTYKFKLEQVGGSMEPKYVTLESGNTTANFDAISYSAADDYSTAKQFSYKITEVAVDTNDENIIYDTNYVIATVSVQEINNVVTVSDPVYKLYDKNGQEIALPAALTSATFTNDYKRAGLSVTKQAKDNAGNNTTPNEQFTLTVKFAYPSDNEPTVKQLDYFDAAGTKLGTVSANGEITLSSGQTAYFKDLPFGTWADVEEKDSKNYNLYYSNPDRAVVADESEFNALTVYNQELKVTPEATKTLEGAALTAGAYTFTLEGNGVSQEVTNGTAGSTTGVNKVTFDTIKFLIDDQKSSASNVVVIKNSEFENDSVTKTFTIKEKPGNNNNIQYDTKEYRYNVTITKNDDGSFSLSEGYTDANGTAVNGAPTFTNNWKRSSASVEKQVKQIVNGSEVDFASGLTFDVTVTFTYPDGYTGAKTYGDSYTAHLGPNNRYKENFTNLPVGTVISINEPDSKGFTVSYPTQSATVAENTTAATVVKNVRPEAAPVNNTIVAYKTLDGVTSGKPEAEQFGFQITGDGYTADNNTAKNDADGKVTFANIQYVYTEGTETNTAGVVYLKPSDFVDDVATKTYTFSELVDNSTANKDTIFDGHTYTAVVTITKTVDENQKVVLGTPVTSYFEGDTAINGAPTFQNAKKGAVQITKVVKKIDDNGRAVDIDPAVDTAAAAQTFTATVAVKYQGQVNFIDGIPFYYTYTEGQNTVTQQMRLVKGENGTTAQVELKHGRVITIADLPQGTEVLVTENDCKGYAKAISPADGKVTVKIADATDSDNKITVTNTLQAQGKAIIPVAKAFTDLAKKAGLDVSDANTYKFDIQYTGDFTGFSYSDTVTLTGAEIKAGTVSKNAKTISFPAEGNYGEGTDFTFTVKELAKNANDADINKNDAHIIYDTTTFNVTFTVKQGADGLEVEGPKYETGVTGVTFTNDYENGKVGIVKKCIDLDGQEFTPNNNQVFTFLAQTSTDGQNWTNYKKDGDASYEIKLKAGESYLTDSLPVGTTVRFTEQGTYDGLTPEKTSVDIAVASGEEKTVEFKNLRQAPGKVDFTLEAQKDTNLNGAKLSAGDFSFTAKGTALDESKDNDAQGKVTFSKLTVEYSKDAAKVTEGKNIVLHDADFKGGKATLTYTIEEVKGNNPDIIYDESKFTATVTITKTENGGSITLDKSVKYTKDSADVTVPVFKNTVKKGSATVIKTDQSGNAIEHIGFALFKVGNDQLSREEVLATGTQVGDTLYTDGEGKVKFENLSLYISDDQPLANPERQWYCVAEVVPNSDQNTQKYNLNSHIEFFQLPETGDKYDVTFEYLNGKITPPASGGEGMFMFKLIGSIIIALAGLAFAGYVYYVRTSGKKASHSRARK